MKGRWPILIALALGACDRSSKDQVLRDLSHLVILPGYRALAREAASLRAAAEDFEAAPTAENLEAARRAWKSARGAWNRTEAFLVGPEEQTLLAAKVDTFPISPEKVEEVVAGKGRIDEAAVELLGTNRKGFMALEYLLFPGTELAGDARRRRLLVAYAENLERVARRMRDFWEPEGDNFLHAFSRAGRDKSHYPSADAAFDDLINRLVLFTEQTADGRLKKPLGMTLDERAPQPGLVQSRRSGHSIEDLRGDLEGVRNVYVGAFEKSSGAGLGARVARASPEIDRAIRDAFDAAFREVSALPGPLDETIRKDPESVLRAFAAVKELRGRILVDLVAVYRTTLKVVPFDGD